MPSLSEAGLPTSPPEFSADETAERTYWRSVSRFARAGQSYSSLDEITAASDLIVIGHLVGTQLGRVQPFAMAPPLNKPRLDFFGVVRVDDVLKGDPVYWAPSEVLVEGLGPEEAMPIPRGQFLMFLQNDALLRQAYGVAPSCDPQDSLHYARPNGYQGVVLVHDNVLAVIQGPQGWEQALGPFPSDLDGQSLDGVKARIEAAIR